MTAPVPIPIDAGDAIELVELLGFVADLCASAPGPMNRALEGFVGPGYDALDLAQDAIRLAGRLPFTVAFDDPSPEPAP
jgi:hypothetical protein